MESKFSGRGVDIFLFCIWAPILCIISLGLATPFIECTVIRWICNNSTIGGKNYRFKGTAGGLFGRWIIWYLLTIITLGIYIFWSIRNQIRWVIENIEMVGNDVQKQNLVILDDFNYCVYTFYSSLRIKPERNAKVICKLKMNEYLKVIKKENEFSYVVTTDGKEGWSLTENLKQL
jgi:predicted membrane chloride channel (bestrophin family)